MSFCSLTIEKMKLIFNLKWKFRKFCYILVFFVALTHQTNMSNLKALPMNNYQGEMVIEELRLKVPADVKGAWLNAEKEIWEPWLSSKAVSYTHLRAHET